MIGRRVALSLLAVSLLVGQLNCSGSRQGGLQAPPGSRSQPRFKPGFNTFSPEQDVQIGRQSAQQILTETPMLDDPEIDGYVKQLGAKLASKVAGDGFPYNSELSPRAILMPSPCPAGFCSFTPAPLLPPTMRANWRA